MNSPRERRGINWLSSSQCVGLIMGQFALCLLLAPPSSDFDSRPLRVASSSRSSCLHFTCKLRNRLKRTERKLAHVPLHRPVFHSLNSLQFLLFVRVPTELIGLDWIGLNFSDSSLLWPRITSRWLLLSSVLWRNSIEIKSRGALARGFSARLLSASNLTTGQ